MEKQGFIHSLPFKLLVALAVGICLGLALSGMENGVSHAILNIVVTVKYIAAQFISFCVPLIIIGFIAPSITRLGNNASRMLIVLYSLPMYPLSERHFLPHFPDTPSYPT